MSKDAVSCTCIWYSPQSPRSHGYNGYSGQQTKWTSAAAKGANGYCCRDICSYPTWSQHERSKSRGPGPSVARNAANDGSVVAGLTLVSRQFLLAIKMEKMALMKTSALYCAVLPGTRGTIGGNTKSFSVREQQDRPRKRKVFLRLGLGFACLIPRESKVPGKFEEKAKRQDRGQDIATVTTRTAGIPDRRFAHCPIRVLYQTPTLGGRYTFCSRVRFTPHSTR
jgi:hypothetical protein